LRWGVVAGILVLQKVPKRFHIVFGEFNQALSSRSGEHGLH
jgi:hypothetical protein